ncbi:hypothetical protein [Streptococcus fryi]
MAAPVKQFILDDEGHLYVLSKPLWKRGLFWSTIILGMLSLFLLVMAIGAIMESVAIDDALARHHLYYDTETDDIQVDGDTDLPVDDSYSPEDEMIDAYIELTRQMVLMRMYPDKVSYEEATELIDMYLSILEEAHGSSSDIYMTNKKKGELILQLYKNVSTSGKTFTQDEKLIIDKHISEITEDVVTATQSLEEELSL